MNTIIPKVTVLMSVYNGSTYLEAAIESILNQTFSEFEFLIIDDGSTDESLSILQHYARIDPRIRLICNNQNKGLTKSLNIGLKQARGRYIARQDADDISLPTRLEKQIAFLDTNTTFGLVGCNIAIIDANGAVSRISKRSTDAYTIRWRLYFHNEYGAHSALTLRTKFVRQLQGYAEEYRYAQDYELWTRMSRHSQLGRLPEVLVLWRAHNQQISSAHKTYQDELAFEIANAHLQTVFQSPVPSLSIQQAIYFYRCEFRKIEYPSQLNHILSKLYTGLKNHRLFPKNARQALRRDVAALYGEYFVRTIYDHQFRYGVMVLFYGVLWHAGAFVSGILEMTRLRISKDA
ncbi:MAG: glycosyltransferase family 2 protein, partial [Candidatus Promineifilaceae bacterium]